MFVVMADVRVRSGEEGRFEDWFTESNAVLSKLPGFISRRLFRSSDGGPAYRIVIEHESKKTFVAMHNSPEHGRVAPGGMSLLDADPARRTFVDVS